MAGMLGIFYHDDKPGPGIDKDAPPKKGLRLFLSIYRREYWNLVKLNGLFLLFCIPVFTIGPAIAAMTKVTMTMVQDHYTDLWYDFKTAFRTNFIQGLAAGLIILAAGAAEVAAATFYLQRLVESLWMYVFMTVILIVFFLSLLAVLYVYPQIVTVRLPIMTVLKNAVLLGISCLKHSFPVLLIIAGIGLIPFLFPAIAPLLFLVYFSNMSFIISFVTWPDIKKYIAVPSMTA